jgi:hypothetical protein
MATRIPGSALAMLIITSAEFSSSIKTRSSEFFGFFSTGEKMEGIIGPAIFGLIGQLRGSSRWGILSVVVLFVTGALILGRVDESEGQRVAETIEASVDLRLLPLTRTLCSSPSGPPVFLYAFLSAALFARPQAAPFYSDRMPS